MLTEARISLREARTVAALGSEHRPSIRVVLELARFEAKAILLHPMFLAAASLSALLAARTTGRGDDLLLLVFGSAIGVAIGGFLSANQATRRARRDRMGELFASLPSPAESRTIGLLLGTIAGPVLISAAIAEIGVAIATSRSPNDPNLEITLIVEIPLAIVAFDAFAVALGRWIPSPVAAPVALVGQVATGMIWWLPWIGLKASGAHLGWHVVYLIAFLVFAISASLLRDRRTLVRAAVTAGGLGGAVLAAILQAP